MDAHMVQQIIKYSDGTETVINYRGVIVDGVLIPDEGSDMSEEIVEEVAAEEVVAPEAPAEEVASEAPAEEVAEEAVV